MAPRELLASLHFCCFGMQVASHAQKYFLRLNSIKDKKDKRRASIHDMTTDDLVTHDVYGASAMGIIPGVPAPVPPAAQRKAIKA